MTPDVQLARDCFNQALHNHIDVLAERENRAASAQREAAKCDGEAWPDFLEFIIKCPPKGN